MSSNNESFYKSLFENSKEVMLLINPETFEIQNCNLSACSFYGYSYDEMLKLKITHLDILTKEEIPIEINPSIANHLHSKHKLSNGQVRDVEISSTPIDLDGKELLFLIIMDRTNTNITNKKTEKAYTMLYTILESSPEIIIFALDSNYHYLTFNSKHKEAMQLIWGKEIEIGMNMLEDIIGSDEDRKKAKANFDRALNGESFVLFEEYGDENLSRLYWQIFWSPIFSNEGNITGLTCFVLNVTELKQAEKELHHEKIFTEALFESIPGYLYVYDESGSLIKWNKKHEEMTGYTSEELSCMTMDDWFEGEDAIRVSSAVAKVLETGYGQVEADLLIKDGSKLHILSTGVRLELAGKIYFTGVGIDISERKDLEIALSQEKKLLETTLLSVGDGVISCDKKGNIVFLNKVAEYLTGWTQAEASGRPIEEVFNIVNEFTRKKSKNIVKMVLESGKTHELANHTLLISKHGIGIPIEDSAAPIVQENEEIIGVVLVFRDFSEKKKKLEEIEFLSYHDYLTKLYNRRFYEEELKRIDTKRNFPIAIIMGDLNGLKLINDSFGHLIGDELLKKTAEAIKLGSRGDDIIARLGGDEFVILLPKTDAFEAERIISRIKTIASKEKVDSINLSISFGYAIKHNSEETIHSIFKDAEDNMYRNKLYESSSMRSKTIDLIMNTLFEKNNREMLHSERVSKICTAISSNLNFDKDAINQIRIAGLIHDIGKIGIPEEILNKPEKLNYDEWNEIKRHPEIGYRILSSSNEFSEMAEYVLEHHERWDGNGYPKGLKGEEISLHARIISIADAYDAMTSKRTYRDALLKEEAINELIKFSNIQFDPKLVNIFINKVLPKNELL